MSKVIHADTRTKAKSIDAVTTALLLMLDSGLEVDVLLMPQGEGMTPQQAASLLGFSRQHVRRLVDCGELEATRLPNSTHWRIPLSSVTAFEARRAEKLSRMDRLSRELDAAGAPLE